MRFFRVNDRCNGCMACVQNCPAKALDFEDSGNRRTLLHNMTRCARCATCYRVCPQDAIEFRYLLENEWAEVVTLDLVRCAVCSQPVHTVLMSKTIAGAEPRLKDTGPPLCDRHRARQAGRMRATELRIRSSGGQRP